MAQVIHMEQKIDASPDLMKAPAPAGPGEAVSGEKARIPSRKLIAAGLLTVLLASAAGYCGADWWLNGRFIVETDDAYVAASSATVTPKISGYVRAVAVDDNARVKAGDPLIVLDDADYRLALDHADAEMASREATIVRIEKQIVTAEAAISEAQAQLASANGSLVNARAQYDRVHGLAMKGIAPEMDVDTTRAAVVQNRSAVLAAQAAVDAAIANVAVVRAQRSEAVGALDLARVARNQAKLNLEHTVIRAPFDGIVGNRAAEVGEFVQPGQRLLAVVPAHDMYVDANFKETQLGGLRSGQTARVTIDAYPDEPLEGRVESVAPASGAVFSLLPPDNATGNFTKITQRFPVRIRLPGEVLLAGRIRPGMSVIAEIDTRSDQQLGDAR